MFSQAYGCATIPGVSALTSVRVRFSVPQSGYGSELLAVLNRITCRCPGSGSTWKASSGPRTVPGSSISAAVRIQSGTN